LSYKDSKNLLATKTLPADRFASLLHRNAGLEDDTASVAPAPTANSNKKNAFSTAAMKQIAPMLQRTKKIVFS
jgi:hypothetical protein